jgi:hypothetical protein
VNRTTRAVRDGLRGDQRGGRRRRLPTLPNRRAGARSNGLSLSGGRIRSGSSKAMSFAARCTR